MGLLGTDTEVKVKDVAKTLKDVASRAGEDGREEYKKQFLVLKILQTNSLNCVMYNLAKNKNFN